MPVFLNGQKVGYRKMPVDIDEETLQKIADKTGGKYYRPEMRNGSGKFMPRLTSWKRRRQSSKSSPSSTNCSRGSCLRVGVVIG